MEASQSLWAYVIALAAVVNGLGIVRLVGGVAEYLKNRRRLNITHHWPYSLMVLFQLLTHALLWWSILGLRNIGGITFLSYLYLLLGPTLLFVATSFLIPNNSDDHIDLAAEYEEYRVSYYATLAIFWVWAIMLWPVFGYPFAPTAPVVCVWLGIAVTSMITANRRAQLALAIANHLVFAYFVARFAMELGKVGRVMTGS
jgi:hypothetical protein